MSASISFATWTDIEKPQALASSISVSNSATRCWMVLREDLLEIRKYRDNWDGYGADGPDQSLVDFAIDFLNDLRRKDSANPPVRVTLTPRGSVSFEWQNSGVFTEAELVSKDRIEWMESRPGKKSAHSVQLIQEAPTGEWGDAWANSRTNSGGVASLSIR